LSVSLATVTTYFLDRAGLAPGTVKSYELTLMPLLAEYGSHPIEILSRQTLVDYLDGLLHLAYTTHHRHQATLQALFNFAVEQGYIVSNPIARLRRRKPDAERGEHLCDQVIRYLTPDQLVVLYQAVASDTRLGALVSLLHRSGARISELLTLDLAQIDLSKRKFQVLGKGNKRRWCFYSEDAAQALSAYCKYDRHRECPALFTAQQPITGEVSRWSYRSAHRDWKRAIEPYPELQGIRLHDLRHTFATERVGLMGIEELRALLGHTNLQTTLRYQKVTSQRAENTAHQAFQSLFNVPD
jgi:integrase/recombinase XerD